MVTSIQHVEEGSSRALVGGQFANFTAGYGNLIEWNQGTWVPLKGGSGVNGMVRTIKGLGSGKGWLIGGDFTGPFSGSSVLRGLGVYHMEEGWKEGAAPGVAQGGVSQLAITSSSRQRVYAAGSFASVYHTDGTLRPDLAGMASYDQSGGNNLIWTGSSPYVRPLGSVRTLGMLYHADHDSSLILGLSQTADPSMLRLEGIHSAGLTLLDSSSSPTAYSAQALPAGMDLLPAGAYPGRGPQQIRQVRAGVWVGQGDTILVSATLSDPSAPQSSWDGLIYRTLGPRDPWSVLSSSGRIYSMDVLRVDGEEIVFYTGVTSQGGQLLFGRWDASRGAHEDLPGISGVPGEGRVVQWLGRGRILLGGKFTSLANLAPCTHVCIYDEWKGAWESPGSLNLQPGETVTGAHFSEELGKIILLLSSPTTFLVMNTASEEWVRVDTSAWPVSIQVVASSMAQQGGSHFLLAGLQASNSTSEGPRVHAGQWSGRPEEPPRWYPSTQTLPTSFSLQGIRVLPILKDTKEGGTAPGMVIFGTGGALLLQDSTSPLSSWSPWIHTSDESGPNTSSSASNLQGCVVQHLNWSLAKGKGMMPAPLVVLVSAAISLGFIFIIVAAGLLGMHGRRRIRARSGITNLDRHALLPLQSPTSTPPFGARSVEGEKEGGRGTPSHPAILRTGPYLSVRDIGGSGSDDLGRPSMGAESNVLPPGEPDQASSYHSNSFEGSSSFLSRDMEGALAGAAVRLGGHDGGGEEGGMDDFSFHREDGMEPDWLPADYQVYQAKHPFEAKEPGELEIHAGDLIYVLDNTDPIWWMGLVDNGKLLSDKLDQVMIPLINLLILL